MAVLLAVIGLVLASEARSQQTEGQMPSSPFCVEAEEMLRSAFLAPERHLLQLGNAVANWSYVREPWAPSRTRYMVLRSEVEVRSLRDVVRSLLSDDGVRGASLGVESSVGRAAITFGRMNPPASGGDTRRWHAVPVDRFPERTHALSPAGPGSEFKVFCGDLDFGYREPVFPGFWMWRSNARNEVRFSLVCVKQIQPPADERPPSPGSLFCIYYMVNDARAIQGRLSASDLPGLSQTIAVLSFIHDQQSDPGDRLGDASPTRRGGHREEPPA